MSEDGWRRNFEYFNKLTTLSMNKDNTRRAPGSSKCLDFFIKLNYHLFDVIIKKRFCSVNHLRKRISIE